MCRTTPLDRQTRIDMQGAFDQDFQDVTVSIGSGVPLPRWAAAAAVGRRLFFREGWYRPDTRLGRWLLAHELAHVVQKRRSGDAAPAESRLLEAEAGAAATAALAGGRFTCRMRDRPDAPRFWGPAGHYYTAYFIMLAAGVANATAHEMAFYAQMPDEVVELDAVQAGIGVGFSTTMNVASTFGLLRSIRNPQAPPSFAEAVDAFEHGTIIQEGLHCLTGRSASAETADREAQLRAAKLGSFEFGLGIHPYGDSFAHRRLDDPSRMYNFPAGHGVEAFRFRPKKPDHIHKRPDLYRDYGLGLYKIVKDQLTSGAPSSSPNRPNSKTVGNWLDEVSSESTEAAQIRKLRNLSVQEVGEAMASYAPEKPENDAMAWYDFSQRHAKLIAPNLKEAALRHANSWVPRQ